MAGRGTVGRPEQADRLSKISVILSVIAGVMLLALLAFLFVTENYVVQQSRTDRGFITVSDYECRELERADTPIGIVKEYTFTLGKELEKDTFLAFYTVHQYAEVYLDGQRVYSMKPPVNSLVKTIGSNWTMLPLYREDAGKEIRVDIIPVYDSFQDRTVEFLLGSKLSICLDRLRHDWPQLLLSVMAIFVGLVFLCIAVYKLLNKQKDMGLLALGLFPIMMGLWRLTDTRFAPFLAQDKPVFLFYTSVAMLMIGTVPLIKSVEEQLDQRSRRILDWYCIAAALVCIAQLLLQVFGGIDLRQNIQITHLMLVAGALILVGNVVYDWIQSPKIRNESIFRKAPIILVVGVLADNVAFYVRGTSSGLLFSLLAVIAYAVITGANMLFHCVQQEKQLSEQNQLLARQERQLVENERQLMESRISIMLSQLQPHFLFNVLNSIYYLCGENPESARKMVDKFSTYLRNNLDSLDQKTMIPFCKEFDHIHTYLELEKIRFDEELTVVYDIQAENFFLPALTVQPLVENAVKHGITKKRGGGILTLATREEPERFVITVTDTGLGFDPAHYMDDGKIHIGIENVRLRLEHMAGGKLTITSTPGVGTTAVIVIPKKEGAEA